MHSNNRNKSRSKKPFGTHFRVKESYEQNSPGAFLTLIARAVNKGCVKDAQLAVVPVALLSAYLHPALVLWYICVFVACFLEQKQRQNNIIK
jgi:hypothetical protein